EVFVPRGISAAVVTWRLHRRPSGATAATAARIVLKVRPLISGRDYHSLHRENPTFRFEALRGDGLILFRPYTALPAIAVLTNGSYEHSPLWYRNFLYLQERERGLDCIEDLASPGIFSFDLAQAEAIWMLAASDATGPDRATAARIFG